MNVLSAFFTGAQKLVEQVPPYVQGGTTVTSIFTVVAAFLEQIHGPVANLGVLLGALWVLLQIYLAVEKRWFRKGK